MRWPKKAFPMRDIVETIGRGLKDPVVSLPPEKAALHFGWLAMFAGADLVASSEKTRKNLGWNPTESGMLADLQQMDYSQSA